MPTTEAFWNQVATYSTATLLVQIVFILAAGILTFLVFTRYSDKANMYMKILLAFGFGWNSIVFFLIFSKSPFSTFFGAPLFFLIAILFVVDIFVKKNHFRLPKEGWQRYAAIFWVLLAFFYPLAGYALGHPYPKTIFLLAPCPLTTFAVALLAAAIPNVDRKVYSLLLVWALIGLPKCLGALDCREDCILFGAGVYGLFMLIRYWKRIGQNRDPIQA